MRSVIAGPISQRIKLMIMVNKMATQRFISPRYNIIKIIIPQTKENNMVRVKREAKNNLFMKASQF